MVKSMNKHLNATVPVVQQQSYCIATVNNPKLYALSYNGVILQRSSCRGHIDYIIQSEVVCKGLPNIMFLLYGVFILLQYLMICHAQRIASIPVGGARQLLLPRLNQDISEVMSRRVTGVVARCRGLYVIARKVRYTLTDKCKESNLPEWVPSAA